MRYGSDHKQQTRAKILKEAAHALRTGGPDRISVAGVMARAGLTHGGFYAHFASKEELISATVDHVFEGMVERFERIAGDQPPAAALSAYIDQYLSTAHRDAVETGCPMPSLSGDISRWEGKSREGVVAGHAALARAIGARLQGIGAEQPQQAAFSVISELVGALILARAMDDPAVSAQILKRSRAALKKRLGLDVRAAGAI